MRRFSLSLTFPRFRKNNLKIFSSVIAIETGQNELCELCAGKNEIAPKKTPIGRRKRRNRTCTNCEWYVKNVMNYWCFEPKLHGTVFVSVFCMCAPRAENYIKTQINRLKSDSLYKAQTHKGSISPYTHACSHYTQRQIRWTNNINLFNRISLLLLLLLVGNSFWHSVLALLHCCYL